MRRSSGLHVPREDPTAVAVERMGGASGFYGYTGGMQRSEVFVKNGTLGGRIGLQTCLVRQGAGGEQAALG